MSDKKWVVLPGMIETFIDFIYVADSYFSEPNSGPTDNKPILIIGDSGSGKSLFIETAKQKFKEHNKSNKVIRINCATLTEELAISEIFGHMKGAFTGATNDKAGVVEVYQDGLLILDEIGELPQSIQAKLLVFIEEGEYRRLGENKTRSSQLKILGTTNKSKESFRPDFWFRFFPLFLPPIYERRQDILYYIAHYYPEIFSRLTPARCLSILAHNWPGNIRELSRIVYIMNATNNKLHGMYDSMPSMKEHLPLLLPKDLRQSSLSEEITSEFHKTLDRFGFNIIMLNKLSLKHGLAFTDDIPEDTRKIEGTNSTSTSESPSGRKVLTQEEIYTLIPFLLGAESQQFYKNILTKNALNVSELPGLENIYICEEHMTINSIYQCFKSLSYLFLQNDKKDDNVFNIKTICPGNSYIEDNVEVSLFKKFSRHNLTEQAFQFVSGVKFKLLHTYDFSMPWHEYVQLVFDSNKEIFRNKTTLLPDTIQEPSLISMTYEEITKKYLEVIVKNSKNLKVAAELSGLKYETLRSKLRALGLLKHRQRCE